MNKQYQNSYVDMLLQPERARRRPGDGPGEGGETAAYRRAQQADERKQMKIHPAIIWEIEKREREKREREAEELRRLPLYIPVPPPPEKQRRDVEFIIEF